VNSLPKTVTRQRRDCNLNPGHSAPVSSTLTTQLWLLVQSRRYTCSVSMTVDACLLYGCVIGASRVNILPLPTA